MTSGPNDAETPVDPATTQTEGLPPEQPVAPTAPPATPQPPPPPKVVPPATPKLPRNEARPAPSVQSQFQPQSAPIATGRTAPVAVVYRSDQDRQRSVYRRANPLWHRFARAVVALGLVTAVGIGVFLAVREARSYLDRDRLPSAGVEVPDIRWSIYAMASASPSPTLNGILTIDRPTGAFDYVEPPSSFRVGVRAVSPDGAAVYVQRGDATWSPADPADPIVTEIRQAMAFLVEVDSADAVLENRLRRGYVDLGRQETEGADQNERTRYEMLLNTAAYADDFPLQWGRYRNEIVPGMLPGVDVPVVIWIDGDNVISQFSAPQSNWEWQRLDHGSDPLEIADPTQP